MKTRTVERLLYAEEVEMNGEPVRQPFPTEQVDQIDPFLMLHHHVTAISPDVEPRRAGIGPHPHRGFSPVTFVYQGACITATHVAITVWCMRTAHSGWMQVWA